MQRAHRRELYYVAPNKVIEDSLGPDFLSVEPGFQLPGAEFPIPKPRNPVSGSPYMMRIASLKDKLYIRKETRGIDRNSLKIKGYCKELVDAF